VATVTVYLIRAQGAGMNARKRLRLPIAALQVKQIRLETV
jgi:hypothetical protein